VKWNTDDYTLEVKCLTYSLVKYGDTFYDNRGVFVELIPRSDNTFFSNSGQRNSVKSLGSLTRPNNVTISYTTPNISSIDGTVNEPGDLWWSIRIGRLFVWYDDGDTSQWVQTQPMGMQPILNTASDISVGVSDLTTPATLTTGSDTVVTISTMAPAARADGSPNALGDLWWSNYTGMFYIWYYDILGPNPNVGIAQWVMATPTGTVPMEGATDYLYPDLSTQSTTRGNIYTSNLTCIISDAAPTTQSDGSALEYGNLWWCSVNGKMFIYWDDGTTVQWTQTTPVGAVSTFYSDDNPFDPTPGPGPGPYPPDPGGEDNIGVIPEPRDQRLLWFDDMTNFLEGDLVNFQLGAPGVDDLTEISKLEALGTPDNNNGLFIRGYNDNALVLPNLTLMVNDTRAVYQFNCDTPTKLLNGDMIFIENSSFAEVNGVHQVIQAGHVIPATITVQIDEDEGTVIGLTIVDPGQYYAENFYITFFGGGGQGAYAYATVDPLVLGGKVKSIEILQAGINYRTVPTAILGDELTNKQFQIYVYGLYGDDNANVKYSAFGEAVENTAAYIEVTSGGVGYKEIPPALGLYKKIGDRAQLVINNGTLNPSGGVISDVTVEQGGSRYVSPTAVFSDRLNAGSGATADVTVTNGVVVSVAVTNGGTGYIEPTITLVEESGKYISLTKTIGRITAGSVINPGRDISVDRSLKPELQITTRCIIRYINTFRGDFIPGSTIYQGDSDVKFVTAKVISYDDKIQQLTLEKVDGVIKENEIFRDDFGTTALVILNGEADCRALVSGTSEPEGVFINDTSKVSAKYAVIQDSLKYQWFSYEIASPLPRVDYENFVNDIVHPAGFIMFSKLDLNDSVESSLRVIDPEFKPQLS
jgi:hypothetical protein